MKINLNLPKEKVKLITKLIAEWKELSPKPLTNFELLHKVEKEISLHITYSILSNGDLDKIKEDLENETED